MVKLSKPAFVFILIILTDFITFNINVKTNCEGKSSFRKIRGNITSNISENNIFINEEFLIVRNYHKKIKRNLEKNYQTDQTSGITEGKIKKNADNF